jgi:hypothetical protein
MIVPAEKLHFYRLSGRSKVLGLAAQKESHCMNMGEGVYRREMLEDLAKIVNNMICLKRCLKKCNLVFRNEICSNGIKTSLIDVMV